MGYIRVHGRNYKDWFRKNAGVEARYDYLYTRKELEPWAERAREVEASADDTYVVTNNHYKGKAVANAAMLKALVTGEPTTVPASVIKTYPKVLKGLAKPASSRL